MNWKTVPWLTASLVLALSVYYNGPQTNAADFGTLTDTGPAVMTQTATMSANYSGCGINLDDARHFTIAGEAMGLRDAIEPSEVLDSRRDTGPAIVTANMDAEDAIYRLLIRDDGHRPANLGRRDSLRDNAAPTVNAAGISTNVTTRVAPSRI